ncbi:MAG: OmpA family protein [Cytophagales bacterium]|nr:MAG: OmpA family protein [Cytophagales bacterium]
MKILAVLVTFIIWSLGSTYWYICKIKYLCDETIAETTVNQVDIANISSAPTLDSSLVISSNFCQVDSTNILPNISTTEKITYNKSFNIVFKYKSTDYINNEELEKSLKELANFSKANPNAKILIIGHTDNVGSAPTNMVLGQGRAESVMKSLYKYGASSNSITPTSKGETEPIADNSTKEGQILNRRVQIIVNN